MSEKLEFLTGETPAGVEDPRLDATTEPTPPESASGESPSLGSASAETVRDAVEPSALQPGQIPITALLEEREKRQAEQARAAALEQQLADIKARQAPPTELTPDERLSVALYTQNLRASRRFAEREYGKETIADIHDWAARRCDADPIFNHQMLSSEDPYEAAYQAFNREAILAEVKPDDFAAFKVWRQAQAANPAAPPPAVATPVPRSLATASGTGAVGASHTPIGPGQAFAATLNR